MRALTEACAVALSLSSVARLHQAFERTADTSQRRVLLLAAADQLDRTLPYPDLKTALVAAGANQVPALIEGRHRIAAVPVQFWRPCRVRPNELPLCHYRGVRAVERLLRGDRGDASLTWLTAQDWLASAWGQYPALKSECASLQPMLSA